MADVSSWFVTAVLLAVGLACHDLSVPSPLPISAAGGACESNLPIQSESQAICRVRELSRGETKLPEYEAIYSATRVGNTWHVSISPSNTNDIGGGYIVEIDAESGEVVTNREGQ